ncbi:hypothetical protein CERSUDRAFT_142277 [Gelatoporia subvermispora B]|uniref:Uncharacterized protein n=1 Tax=Ceriporiopsis subvermispora (strain B) TaxID=914234 RepID=M2R576_CERS8|nr:hypothetical protein CERSUDRAFT_142277 [Gelatoporia subvermispora B]
MSTLGPSAIPTPISVSASWRPISSARTLLSRFSKCDADTESALLKAIRATLRGSRGTSEVHSTLYPACDSDCAGEDELSWNSTTVIFSSGGIIRRRWSFADEGQPVQYACIALFEQQPPSAQIDRETDGSSSDTGSTQRPTFGPFHRGRHGDMQDHQPPKTERAVYIFLRSVARVYLMNGNSYIFHLPFIVRRAWPLHPHGVLVQRVLEPVEVEEARLSGEPPLPTIFSIVNPFSEPAAIGIAEKIPPSLTDEIASVPAEENVVWVAQRGSDPDELVVTVDTEKSQLTIWRYVFTKPSDKRTPVLRTRAHKRLSLGTPAVRKQAQADETPATSIPAQLPDVTSLPASVSINSTMAALAVDTATTDTSRGATRGRPHDRQETSITLDRTGLAPGSSGGIVEYGKLQTSYWMESLHAVALPSSEGSMQDMSIALFDSRWDGTVTRSLLAICLPASQKLLIFSVVQTDDEGLRITPLATQSAKAVVSVRATRFTVYDLLVLRQNGTLHILTHGLKELPIALERPRSIDSRSSPSIETDHSLRPILTPGEVVGLKDAVESSLTLRLSDGSEARSSLNLIPQDDLTLQCILMLTLILPADEAFALHERFLRSWCALKWATTDGTEFRCFVTALNTLFSIPSGPRYPDPTASAPGSPWDLLSRSAVPSRFREDPVMKGLQQPPQSASAKAISRAEIPGKPHHLLAPILNALHYVAEDMRLAMSRYHTLLRLVPVICRIAVIIRPEWADYWKRLCPDAIDSWASPSVATTEYLEHRLPVCPPDALVILYGRINNPDWSLPPPSSAAFATVFKLTGAYAFGRVEPLARLVKLTGVYMQLADPAVTDTRKRAENALIAMLRSNIGPDYLRSLPLGIAAPLREATRTCQMSPAGDWPMVAYQMIGRHDLAEVLGSDNNVYSTYGYRSVKEYINPSKPRKSIHEHIKEACINLSGYVGTVSGVEIDLEDFTRIRFGQDKRLEEVARMLCSSTVPTIKAIERPDLSEVDQAKEHQHQAVRLAERTLALPLGRALFTFGSVPTVTREAYVIPKIEYTVRLQPPNLLIAPEAGKIPVECMNWGDFHNGVAAGLRISSQTNAIESTWIKFNKPSELTPEHAGFLYALGLTGHLREMLTWHTFGYLTPKHDMTSIGVLLGLSAAHAGTCNRHVTKLLAVHTPALLPTPQVDLNVPLMTQAAGLIGIGLLYLGTRNRRMAEVCLEQISRKDLYQPDLSNEYREAYTLSAALACGMVMLGKGSTIPADVAILARLRVLVHGEGSAVLEAQQKRPSFDVNLTSPAATIALGLMYLKTGRQDVADILVIPDTIVALNSIQPSFLLLRTLSRALIMWDKIAPNNAWLTQQIPMAIAVAMDARFRGKPVDDAFELAYYNILAGCCFAIALKYAGTAREEAYLLVIHYYDMFSQLAYTNGSTYEQRIKRAAIRDGLNLISIALNMVMAGTGEINCLRRLRYAYGMYNQPVRYGTHVATHMSLGLLFLGGGRYTLGTSDAAIACMITAFFPRWAPISSDNKSYLQALRHLWVLAVEPRCLIARDVDTKEVVYLPVKIKVKENNEVGTTQLISPTLIPEIDKILSIRIDTPRYWPFYLDIANFPRHKESLLQDQTLFVKRRTAFLSYMEDPKGSRSLFVRSGSSTSDAATLDFPQLTDVKTHPASDFHHFITSFSNDPLFLAFADRFCREDGETPRERLFHLYSHASLLDSILQDKSQTIQSHLMIYHFRAMDPQSQYFVLRLQDLKFATDFYNKIYDRRFSGRSENNPRTPLIRESTLSGALHALDVQLDKIRAQELFQVALKQYCCGESIPTPPEGTPEALISRYLAWYLQRNCVPVSTILVILRGLAEQAHEQCLGAAPPQGTTNAALLNLGIKEVLHAAGTQLSTAMGSGWSIRSLDEIIAAWGGASHPGSSASTS